LTSKELLNISNLRTYFYVEGKEIKAVDGVDLTINKGETVCLVGESGSGKSITSMSILRLIPEPPGKIISGNIKFNGKELLHLSEQELNEIRGNEISMIFQEPMTSLNPVFTIGEQISEGLRYHHNLNKEQAREKAIEFLRLVGFPRADEIVDEYPHQLSGGMRQRAMIAMAMSLNPQILIADEPTTALDVTIQAQILELMKDMKAKFNMSVLLITHDLGVVAEMADRVYVMYGGQIVEETDVIHLFENPYHPYTKGLLHSIPSLVNDNERLTAIEGTVPPAHAYPIGCRFAPRCKERSEICEVKEPQLKTVEIGHKVRCHLY